MAAPAPRIAADELPIATLCSHCHRLPEPSILPKQAWPSTIYQMGSFGGFGVNVPREVDLEAVADWFVSRAPEVLPAPPVVAIDHDARFAPTDALSLPNNERAPFVSNLLVHDLVGDADPELVICDIRGGGVWLGPASAGSWTLQQIATLASPARAEAADLDGDGRTDLVVAVLGSSMAMDHLLGQVVWLQQSADGSFAPRVLAENMGRVADVQPADFDGDGDLDLAVAEFGWRQTGRISLLINEPGTEGRPRFTQRELDGNHGGSRIVPADIDKDGRLDLVALFAQEHELVRVYRNTPTGWQERHDVYRAPHPAWGHSSMQLVDLDRDGDADILLTNGDSYDNALLKPYHGIRWLENQGDFTFASHDVADMPGSYAAAAADLDGDGDLDLVASALAEPEVGSVDVSGLASLVWLEQLDGGGFQRHVLEVGAPEHPFLTLHDDDADGFPDILVGNGRFDDTATEPAVPCVRVWTNRGRD